ncbi:hypothetical protein WG902_06395 [Ramlibacter sp. PS3R-8]|uniref:hypothetical protein n=1 Tax=Ramlibacter sp. PS3R-8 TaxID=3133437 RepID=UPI0030AB95BC
MKLVKLHAWRDAELSGVSAVLHESLTLWRQAWGLPLPRDARVCCVAAEEVGPEPWQPLDTGAAAGAWVHWSPAAQAELQLLFGSDAGSSPFVQGAATACRQDACRRVATALGLDRGASFEVGLPRGKWSGAVVATLPCNSRFLIDATCVPHALRRSSDPVRPRRSALPPLAPLLESASRCPTRVEARLTDCDLDLAMLQRLRIGDVVRLPHPLDQPLCMRDASGRAVFDGYLARSGACRAVELVATSA